MGYILAALTGTIIGFSAVVVGAHVIHNWLTGLKNDQPERLSAKDNIRRKW